jgi:hypothetical protein
LLGGAFILKESKTRRSNREDNNISKKKGNNMEKIYYRDEPYKPIIPIADNEELANKGIRVILYHKRFGAGFHTAEILIAPQGIVSSGWVIGIIETN